MTEIAITAADREWATAIRAALIRGLDGMPSYPVDIIPPIVAQIRHQARTEALEETAKAMKDLAESARYREQIGDDDMQVEHGAAADAFCEAYSTIRALSRSGGE